MIAPGSIELQLPAWILTNNWIWLDGEMGGQTGKGFQIIYLSGGFCKYTLFGVKSNKNNSTPQIYVDINVHPCC